MQVQKKERPLALFFLAGYSSLLPEPPRATHQSTAGLFDRMSGRHRVGVYEEATIPTLLPADPTDPGDAADLSTPQGILLFQNVVFRHGQSRTDATIICIPLGSTELNLPHYWALASQIACLGPRLLLF
jgi:hypothetical protein